MKNNETVELLNDIIKGIKDQLEVKRCRQKIMYLSGNPELKSYNNGIIDGARIALKIINERIDNIQHDSNSDKTKSL